MMGKSKIISIMLVLTLVISFLSHAFLIGPFVIYGRADPGNISYQWDNSTTLNVTVLQDEPRINWYDFQYNNSGTWISRLNQQIDVNNSAEYRFIVNISSDQGWDDIEYIFIEAWADLGDDSGNNYNSTTGGNKNLNITYENTSSATWILHWPDDEASINLDDCTEWIETDTDGSPGNTECYNITFAFTPGYQFRYAPGSGGTGAGYDDLWSWNFNITAIDQGNYLSYNNPTKGESIGEFGVYTYTEIISVGWPVIIGNPGTTATVHDTGGSGNITLEARSNGNYSLAVDLDQLDHETNPGANMANTTVSIRGGDVDTPQAFPGNGPVYLYGGSGPTYRWAQNDSTSFSTNDIEYRIAIPLAQTPGDYTGTIRYHLMTQI
jgi:hypothetical protein